MQVEEMLINNGLAPDTAAMVVEALASDSEHGDFKLILRDLTKKGTVVAIKSDDFPALETAATIAVGLIGNSLVAWAPAAIVGLVMLLFKFRRKGIPLSGNQAAIAVELNRHPRLTVKQLVQGLQVSLTEDEIYAELVIMSSIPQKNGTNATLTSVDSQGRWTLVGV